MGSPVHEQLGLIRVCCLFDDAILTLFRKENIYLTTISPKYTCTKVYSYYE